MLNQSRFYHLDPSQYFTTGRSHKMKAAVTEKTESSSREFIEILKLRESIEEIKTIVLGTILSGFGFYLFSMTDFIN